MAGKIAQKVQTADPREAKAQKSYSRPQYTPFQGGTNYERITRLWDLESRIRCNSVLTSQPTCRQVPSFRPRSNLGQVLSHFLGGSLLPNQNYFAITGGKLHLLQVDLLPIPVVPIIMGNHVWPGLVGLLVRLVELRSF